MIEEILFTEEVDKRIKKLPKDIQKKLKKKIELLLEDPFYPSLHFKRFHAPEDAGVFWEFRIDRKYRGILQQELDENGEPTACFYLVAVGTHDILEKFTKSLSGS